MQAAPFSSPLASRGLPHGPLVTAPLLPASSRQFPMPVSPSRPKVKDSDLAKSPEPLVGGWRGGKSGGLFNRSHPQKTSAVAPDQYAGSPPALLEELASLRLQVARLQSCLDQQGKAALDQQGKAAGSWTRWRPWRGSTREGGVPRDADTPTVVSVACVVS